VLLDVVLLAGSRRCCRDRSLSFSFPLSLLLSPAVPSYCDTRRQPISMNISPVRPLPLHAHSLLPDNADSSSLTCATADLAQSKKEQGDAKELPELFATVRALLSHHSHCREPSRWAGQRENGGLGRADLLPPFDST
jgi:hypothetical protein